MALRTLMRRAAAAGNAGVGVGAASVSARAVASRITSAWLMRAGGAAAGVGALAATASAAASRRFVAMDAATTAAAATAPSLTLYQYEVCPYCCIAKAYLDLNSIPYKPVETNPISKKELKENALFLSTYKQLETEIEAKFAGEAGEEAEKQKKAALKEAKFASVPICVFGDEAGSDAVPVKGSIAIIKHCQAQGLGATPWDAQCDDDIQWAFKKFIILFPPNIYRNMEEALEAFSYISQTKHFTPMERVGVHWGGAALMWAVARFKLRKKYGITDERQALYDGAQEWVKRVGDAPFRGGEQPNMADVAVYGMLSAMRNMKTLADLRANVAPLDAWYSRMQAAVGPSSRLPVA